MPVRPYKLGVLVDHLVDRDVAECLQCGRCVESIPATVGLEFNREPHMYELLVAVGSSPYLGSRDVCEGCRP